MIYIIMIILALAGMAKRKPRKRFRKYIRGAIDKAFALGTLAGNTLVSATFDGVVNERTFISSVKALYAMDEFTSATDDGPIIIGLAHSDYTDAEIEAWVENTTAGSWDEGNLVAQEIGRRKIRRVGVFEDAIGGTGSLVLNEGRMITTKCGWILLQGQTVRVWAYNAGSSALATSDPTVHVQGHANLWPR